MLAERPPTTMRPSWKAEGRRFIDLGDEGDIEAAGYELLSGSDDDPRPTIRVTVFAIEPADPGYSAENDECGVGPFAGYIDPVRMAEFLVENGYAAPLAPATTDAQEGAA